MKNTKIFLVFFLIFITLIILVKLTSSSYDNKIISFLKNEGYSLNSDNLYYKNISSIKENEYIRLKNKDINASYEGNYFNISDYSLTKKIYEYNDSITSELDAIYSYKNTELLYTYRIYYENSNVYIKGSYDDEFVCDVEFASGIYSNSLDDTICPKIELKINDFSKEVKTFFPNIKYINYMKK